jgi:hypothetical protein
MRVKDLPDTDRNLQSGEGKCALKRVKVGRRTGNSPFRYPVS